MKRKITTLLLFTVLSVGLSAQAVKGLYVNGFVDIVGDTAAEDLLLSQAQANGYNYLILYNLYFIHRDLFDITDPVAAQPLADFIEKARTNYGMTQIAAVGETFSSFTNIHDYNLDHAATPNQQFDHYNIEFEFWNSTSTGPGGYYCTTYLEDLALPCDTDGAFTFLIDNLCDLQALTDAYAYIDTEMYIGWPTAAQALEVADCTDRVLVHYYRTSDVYSSGNSIYNYGSDRLPDLAASAETSVVMPIFSNEPSFMGPWLETHPEDQAFDTWLNGLNGYNDAVGAWKANTIVDGQVWFRYSGIPMAPLAVDLLHFSVRNTGNANLLSWQLEFDESLLHLDLERALTAAAERFETIASITNPYGTNAAFSDKTFRTGLNTYRLKFLYADGSYDYSDIVMVENEAAQLRANWAMLEEGQFLQLESPIEQQVLLELYAANGQLMTAKSIDLIPGAQNIPLEQNIWPVGLYFIIITSSNEKIALKMENRL